MTAVRLILCVLLWLVPAQTALAAEGPEAKGLWKTYLISLFLAACVGVASLISSKRGHKD